MKRAAYAFAALLFCGPLLAETFACIQNGRVIYTDTPCAVSVPKAVLPEKPKTAAEIQAEFDAEVAAKKAYEEKTKTMNELRANELEHRSKPQSVKPSLPKPAAPGATDEGKAVGALIVVILVGMAYFIPSFIAKSRKHHNLGAIFLVNLIFGWTVLGWFGALIWSATAVKITVDGKIAN